MREKFIVLVGAKCVACDPRGRGSRPGSYFAKTYDLIRWKRKPKCANCRSRMVKVWETKVPLDYIQGG